MQTHNPELAQTHSSQTRAHITEHGRDYNISPSDRLDKIKLFPFCDASLLPSNAGFSNNTRFYCGTTIMRQISNSCQTFCDRMQLLFWHSASGARAGHLHWFQLSCLCPPFSSYRGQRVLTQRYLFNCAVSSPASLSN